jgi:ubiquinone/menaquinone biosynthesis C-methylase UbiE
MPLVVDPDGIELATIRELVDVAGMRVLEIGCGDGRMTFTYAGDAARVLAIDPDAELIDVARAATPPRLLRRIRFAAADAAEIDLPTREFDLALFSWSL